MRASRCIRVAGLPPGEVEKITLLAAILGWAVVDGAVGEEREPRPADWDAGVAVDDDALQPVAAGAAGAWVNGRCARPAPAPVHGPDATVAVGGWNKEEEPGAGGACRSAWAGAAAMAVAVAAVPAGARAFPHGALPAAMPGPVVADGGQPVPAPAASPRLELRPSGSVIEVQAADDALAVTLARLGLDRLVLPLSLAALEELLAIAG